MNPTNPTDPNTGTGVMGGTDPVSQPISQGTTEPTTPTMPGEVAGGQPQMPVQPAETGTPDSGETPAPTTPQPTVAEPTTQGNGEQVPGGTPTTTV